MLLRERIVVYRRGPRFLQRLALAVRADVRSLAPAVVPQRLAEGRQWFGPASGARRPPLPGPYPGRKWPSPNSRRPDSWDLKSNPLKLDRGVTVLNAEDLVKRHLEILAAKLCGDKSWLCEQRPMATPLADLKDVGIELRILE
jgi:hypothetical protein